MRHLISYIIEKFEENKAYIMTGLPGSGKSTWIKQNIEDKVVVISKDLIRQDMGIITDQNVKAIGDKKQEKEVNRKQEEQIKQAIIDNKDIVIDNTNIGKSRKHLIDILRKHKYYIIGVNIKTPYEICYKRRKDCIPEKIMKQMNDSMEFMTNKDCDKIINVKYNKI